LPIPATSMPEWRPWLMASLFCGAVLNGRLLGGSSRFLFQDLWSPRDSKGQERVGDDHAGNGFHQATD